MKRIYREPMGKHTTISVGGAAKLFAYPENEKELLSLAKNRFLIIGGGSNVIFTDDGFDGTVISLARCSNKIIYEREEKDTVLVRAGGGVSLITLLEETNKNNLSGLEFLWGVPGSVGGACCTNAGAFGSSFLQFVREFSLIKDKGEIKCRKEDLKPAYRKGIKNGIVKDVLLELKKGIEDERLREIKRWRQENQPLGQKTAGCIFKNPPGNYAGRLIESAGLKGKRRGGAGISEKHANFIVNYGNATSDDILSLIELVREEVFKEFGVRLELEVEIVDKEGH